MGGNNTAKPGIQGTMVTMKHMMSEKLPRMPSTCMSAPLVVTTKMKFIGPRPQRTHPSRGRTRAKEQRAKKEVERLTNDKTWSIEKAQGAVLSYGKRTPQNKKPPDIRQQPQTGLPSLRSVSARRGMPPAQTSAKLEI